MPSLHVTNCAFCRRPMRADTLTRMVHHVGCADRKARQEMGKQTVMPMQLQVGDRLTDETGEWEIAGRPNGTAVGKLVHVRVRKVGEPAVIEERTWSVFEQVAVRRVDLPPFAR